MRTVYAQKNKKIILGRQGEDKAVRVVWPGIVSDWSSLYGDGSFQLSVRRFGDENAYPVAVEVNGDDIRFTVTSAETAIAGNGKCELTYIANGSIAKSATWETVVLNSLTGQTPSEPPEEPAKSWFTAIQGQIGNLANLETTSKDNLVAAINEAAKSGGGGGASVELDTTLTQSGKAADAKAVGDALAELEAKEETDPTVPEWAKAATKPSYTAEEVGARPADWMPTAAEVGALPSTYTPPDQTAEQVGADPAGTATSAVSGHNTNNGSHADIRLLIDGLTTRLNALANSTDEDLDQMAELVAYIKSNKSLIDGITTSKVNVSDIVNNLTTNVGNKPLSAAQGVALKELIDALSNSLVGYQPKGDYLTQNELQDATDAALAQAKESGEFDGADGITPSIGDNGNWYLGSTDTGKPSRGEKGDTGAQQTPLFASTTADCTDTSKVYVLPDGYIYGYINGAWTNTGHKFVSTETLNKVIAATCDTHTATGVNYNLLKPSQFMYQTRLQNDSPDPVSSNTNNLVTNWIPVTYGKYYTPSSLYNGSRLTYKVGLIRVNLKLADDTIVPYATGAYPYAIDADHMTVGVDNSNAVAIRFQLQVNGDGNNPSDISTADKFKAFEPMIVEGDEALESYNKALTLAYMDGDAEAPSTVEYTLKHEQEFITIKNRLENVSPVRFDFKHELADVSQYLTDSGYASLNTVRTTTETAFNALVASYPDYASSEDAAVRVGLAYPSYANYTTNLYKFLGSSFTGRTRGKIFLYAGEHGDEPGAVVNCYIFMRKLIDTLVTDANAYKLYQNFDFYVLPCLNGKGLDDTTRYNGNGVDINRNYPTSGWAASGQPYERGYTGASAGSEFETQLIMKLVDDIKPDIIIDHHSYGNDGIQFYNSFAYADIRTLMIRSYDDCIVAFKKNLPQYFGGGFNKIDGIISQSDVGHSPVWFKENGLLGGCVEISMNINYLNGIATSGSRDWMGSTTMSIAEYTLSNQIMRLAEKYTL